VETTHREGDEIQAGAKLMVDEVRYFGVDIGAGDSWSVVTCTPEGARRFMKDFTGRAWGAEAPTCVDCHQRIRDGEVMFARVHLDPAISWDWHHQFCPTEE